MKEKARCRGDKKVKPKDADKDEAHDEQENATNDETKEVQKKKTPTQQSPMKLAANAAKRVVAKQSSGATKDPVRKSLADEFERLSQKKQEQGEGQKRKKAKALELSSVDTLLNFSANLHTSNVWSKNSKNMEQWSWILSYD